jgi:signal peptidase I
MFSEELKAFRRLGFRHVCNIPLFSLIRRSDRLAHLQVLLQILNFASVLTSGFMIWKGLGLITNTESPIVVVLRCAPPSLYVTRRMLTESTL